jgi:hypothetical protein
VPCPLERNSTYLPLPEDGLVHTLRIDNNGSLHSDVAAEFHNGVTIAGLAGYYAARDGYHHAIVALDEGDICDLRYSSGGNVFGDVRAHFANVSGLAAYYDPRAQYQHLLVALADGTLQEVWFPGVATAGAGGVDTRRAQFGAIAGLGGYFSPEGGSQHAIVLTPNGDTSDVRWTA